MNPEMKKNYVALESFSVKLDSGTLICNSDLTLQVERNVYGLPENLTW